MFYGALRLWEDDSLKQGKSQKEKGFVIDYFLFTNDYFIRVIREACAIGIRG